MKPQAFPTFWRGAALAIVALVLVACGSSTPSSPQQPDGAGGHYKVGQPYQIKGRWYEPVYEANYSAVGVASWYGKQFHGRKTANGETFDMHSLSAAHKTLPLPSFVRVTNLENDRSVVLRVNDRGPFAGDRIIDVSRAAAEELGFRHQGLADVEVEFLELADSSGRRPTPSRSARRDAPRPVTPAPATVAMASCSDRYVQVGAFRDRNGADQIQRRLAGALGGIGNVAATASAGLTHVRVGPFSTTREADEALNRVIGAGYWDAYIVRAASSGSRCRTDA
ncbi:MAG: septal ring lytic transglycosylase RlpA family protein [Pseudomonadota bacterium]